jgi:hypothetical protein
MPSVLKPMLVSQNGEHALQALVGKLDDPPAPLADEMLVTGLGIYRLVSFESLAELVRSHQPALDQKLERAIDGGQSHGLSLAPELAANAVHREVVW